MPRIIRAANRSGWELHMNGERIRRTNLKLMAMLMCGWLWASHGSAQTPAAANPQPDYHPSMGDLMTMAIQPRHTKLWHSGHNGNCGYAEDELSERRNA